jgi:nickel-dependent lactate racemase
MPRSCKGTTQKGNPCKTAPLKDSDYCLAHGDQETRDLVGFGGSQPGAGRPAKPKPSEIARELVEEHIEATLRPHFNALGYEIVLDENGAHLTEKANGGAKLYGESKDGYINVSEHDDLRAMIAASEKLLDRVYGRPKQVSEVSGPDGAPVQVASTFDLSKLSLDERRSLLELVERAAA